MITTNKRRQVKMVSMPSSKSLLQKLTDKLQQTYYPEEAVTVDEGMCPFRGRVSFRVYMPQKPNKYGMKLLILAESRTGYIWNFEMYHGKDPELDNSAAGVVKRLLDKLTNKGHTVYFDRFYTSVPLAEELAKANTGLIGTIMKSRKGFPKALKEAKIKKRVNRCSAKRRMFLPCGGETRGMCGC
jgi:hypothetical protein